jgi:hypothetical protein
MDYAGCVSRNAPTILNVALQRNYFMIAVDRFEDDNHVLLNKNDDE